MKKYIIYGLKLKNNDTIMYIGMTINLKNRLWNHKSDNRNRIPEKRRNWIQSNKNNIEIVVLEENILTKKEAEQKEIYFIKLYRSKNECELNISDGGHGTNGCKMSDSLRKIHKERMLSDNPMKNKIISEKVKSKLIGIKLKNETKNRIKQKLIKLKHTPKGKEHIPIYQLDLNNKIIAEFESITSAAKFYNYDISNIAKCCRKEKEKAYNYKWIKKEEYGANN